MKRKRRLQTTGGRRHFDLFVFLLLLAIAGGLAMDFLRVTPYELWRHLVGHAQTPPVRAETTPAPISKPTVQATPAPSTVAALPKATPAPSALPDPRQWILEHKNRAPKSVTLRVAEQFPAVFNGSVVGAVMAPVGTKVGLVDFHAETVSVVFNGGGKVVPIEATDVLDLVRTEMTKPEPEPTPPMLTEETPAPVRSPKPLPNPGYGTEFVHPGVVLTKANLREIERGVRSGREPWKSWFKQYDGDPSGVGVAGQFEEYGRNPDLHRGEFQSDMWQLYRMAMLWTVKKDRRAAEKGMEILRTYAQKHKRWSGVESSFMRGDCMNCVVAAEILRWTYPGWTEQDTTDLTRYFSEMWWDPYIGGDNTGAGSHLWTANQGTIGLKVALEAAIFCDDRVRFNMCLNAFLTDPLTGLENSLPNGELGDTGRDTGHWTAQAIDYGWICQMAWAQGIDLFAQRNYRMIAISEFLARNQLYSAGVCKENAPYIPYGCSYDFYPQVSHFEDFRGQDFFEVIDTYARRKQIAAPFTHQLLEHERHKPIYTLDDSIDAQPICTTWSQPQATTVSNLHSRDVGNSRGSMDASGDEWTVESDSNKVEDGYHFAYLKAEGDWTFVAREASVDGTNHGGAVMVTERLEPPNQVHATWLEAGDNGSAVRWTHGQHSYGWPWDMRYYGCTRLPLWLRLVRRGVFISSWQSVDGVSWAATANVRFDNLADELYVGLATWGGRTRFDHVSFGSAPSSLPTAPMDVEVAGWSDKAEISWKTGANTVFCDVLRAEQKGGPYETVGRRITTNKYTDTSLGRGMTYYYTISPAGYSGRGPNSTEVILMGDNAR